MRFLRKIPTAMALLASFARELIASNWAVLRIVIRPRLELRPGVLAYKTALRTDIAKTWLANLVTLTPGTLTLFISDDKTTLYIHTLDIDDPQVVAETIRRAFETKLLELEK